MKGWSGQMVGELGAGATSPGHAGLNTADVDRANQRNDASAVYCYELCPK